MKAAGFPRAGSVRYAYDAVGVRYHASAEPGTGAVEFGHAQGMLVEEYGHTSGYPIQRRYVPGDGADEVLVWYEGAGTGDRRWLLPDERGSVVAVAGGSGSAAAINRYDEYGMPAPGNLGRFGYTGQLWMAEAGLWDYKARAYAPGLGRFMQTDPLDMDDGPNLYAYVGGDPIQRARPGRHGGRSYLGRGQRRHGRSERDQQLPKRQLWRCRARRCWCPCGWGCRARAGDPGGSSEWNQGGSGKRINARTQCSSLDSWDDRSTFGGPTT